MRLTLPMPPSVNTYWRSNRGRVHISHEGRAYKETVGKLARAAKLRPLDGEVALTLEVHRPALRGDLDNTLKALLDALKGTAFHDDSQVARIVATRHLDRERPRVEVEIGPAEARNEPKTAPEFRRPEEG